MTTLEATYAADKLAKLARCAERGIKPMVTDDGTRFCLNDQIELVGHPLQHSENELRDLHAAVGDGWPAGPLTARLRRAP